VYQQGCRGSPTASSDSLTAVRRVAIAAWGGEELPMLGERAVHERGCVEKILVRVTASGPDWAFSLHDLGTGTRWQSIAPWVDERL
jgi:hypothetical protein